MRCQWPRCKVKVTRGKFCPEHSKKAAKLRREKVIKAGEKISRDKIYQRDRGICGICGEKIDGPWHMDHVIPIRRGGKHTEKNVQVSHPDCNLKKGSKSPFTLRKAA